MMYMVLNDPMTWMLIWNPSMYRAIVSKTKGTEDALNMFVCDEQLMTDTLPLGSYRFPCRVFVYIALHTRHPLPETVADPDHRLYILERQKYYCNGRPHNYEPEDFDEWKKWADDVRIQ